MHGRLAVLTVVFVFASSAFLPTPASAQGAASLDGMVCVQPYWMAGANAANSSMPADSGCMSYGAGGLPGATITLTRSGTLPSPAPAPLGPSTLSATTDANGYYSFANVAAGDYDFTVSRAGFKSASGTVTVESGARQDAILAGDVVDAKGEVTGPDGALAKAELRLCCGQSGEHTATTGADGRYSASVQAGYWSVSVMAPGYQGQERYLLVDGSAIDFSLERIPPQDAKLAGRVLDQDGAPVEGARVSLYSYGGGYGCCYAYDTAPASDCYDCSYSSRPYSYSGENVTFTDAQGRFLMGAYSGGNGLSISKDGYAHHSRSVDIQPGGTASAEVTLMKYPEKTAKVVGKVVDAKTGKGLANAYISLQSPEYGLYECSQPADSGSGGGSSGSTGEAKPMVADSIVPMPPEYDDPGCAIQTRSDGSFEGLVSPGYAIVSVWVDTWSACYERMAAEGSSGSPSGSSSSFDCDTYYSWVTSQVLPADATTAFDVRVRQRPGPDAEASGYVLDAETGKAIPGAQVSFSNQDSYGYGQATTDGDGSYRIALRSGYHSVSVWAEGHLRWEGVVDVAKGDTPFDITIQPGQESNGYYGPYYGSGYAMASSDAKAGSSVAAASTGAPAPDMAEGASRDGSASEQYQDLGGGLGPYDARKRADQLEEPSKGSPGLGLVALLAALGAVYLARRRLA